MSALSVDGTYQVVGLRQIPRNAISEIRAYCILGCLRFPLLSVGCKS